ncbi:hypothetical protein SSABA_v1c02090 [Spiroplasma sabaudiense Ar-1343]|uniref:Ribosomal processing cysteine protease Prp n=1 Tax=Spiroplasma sabaudiense Ar-1343 TaxID=1276257 RepID=W6A9G2_9MOLU|nr:ribosomal-processing cysteine protease Prp [Spiroplasma sabaudiense]AHI53621.1 hypothetical protein SSABA_v1c02090 [Spiroplasma sabaudiense Ar-1343]
MIEVKIKKTNSHYQSFVISGHAQSGPYGQDLVCAGVSAIIGGALNAFDKIFSNFVELVVSENKVKILINNLSNEEIQVACQFLHIQLESIYLQYPKNINIQEVS